ncbi:hypothetical protein MH117_03765 [Paenibacillus sp. ACRRX]|nr:hypothetical protein [Paenibacillus sp. ACRRX]MDK8179554.1 hypothetical protein [Paenibacillus sp. UMB4589-SE434]
MVNKIWIFPPYEKDKVSIISVVERVEQRARYIRQSGPPGRFAIIDFVIEPYEGGIVFENEARLQDDLRGDIEWELAFPMVICSIYDGLKMFIQYKYNDSDLAIGNFKFKLKSLEIHKYDSKLTDFAIATTIGLNEIFISQKLSNQND